MKAKGLPNISGPRMPHLFLDIVFPIDSMPLAKINICINESLLKKLTMGKHHSYLPFYYNF